MSEYQEIAYRKLGLCGEGYDVGTMRYIDLSADVLDALCIRRLNNVGQDLYEARPPATESRLWRKDIAANYFLRYHEWSHVLKTIRSHEPKEWRDTSLPADVRFKAVAESRFMRRLYEGGKYEPTLAGWKRYLKAATPRFYEFLLTEIPVRLPYDMFIHAYIVGGSRSGKTELLKLLAHSTMKRRDFALVFIEPAGEASDQIAKWKENVGSDCLVYFDPTLEPGMTPTINPFQISGIRPSDRSDEALAVKRVVALQLVDALQQVISKGESGEVSGNMEMVLTHSTLALMDYEGATLWDLKRLMDNDPGLLAHARSLTHYRPTAEFFERDFQDKGLAHTKGAITRKLYRIFATGIFEDLTCATERTIDLERMLEERKVIVFNLSKGATAEEGSAFGRLITALLLGIAFRRGRPGSRKRPIPIMYIMDECQNFLTKSVQDIVSETAKFGLFITMAQPRIGQGMNVELRDTVLNASVQIGGVNKPHLHGSVASMLGVEAKHIAALHRGEFIINMAGVLPFKFSTYKHLLDSENNMSDRQWERVKADQLRRYYRRTKAPVPVEVSAPVKVAELAGAEEEEVI